MDICDPPDRLSASVGAALVGPCATSRPAPKVFHNLKRLNRGAMDFSDLLSKHGVDARDVLVLRHRPHEPKIRKILPWLSAERPDLFNAYQQTQGERLEKAMLRAKHIASFIGHEPGKALFAGLYAIGANTPLSHSEYWTLPLHLELQALGMKGFGEDDKRKTVLRFDLDLTDFYGEWKGRLIIGWPPPERVWWRRAHTNDFPVQAVLEESTLVGSIPSWDEIILSWEELETLPRTWKAALAQWRGIYFIFDGTDAKGYVGSAYGAENILGRWLNYAASGHGGNRLLKERDPRHFQFCILQRVSPDMDADEVIRVEATWKERLHTRHPLGFNAN
jgi:hypothetical protein